MKKPAKTKPRTPKKVAMPKKVAQNTTSSRKKAVAKQATSTPTPVEVELQVSHAPAKRFTLSSSSARHVEKELDSLLETLPELRKTAPRWAEMIDSDEEEVCYGCFAIAAAGVLYASARDDENKELSDLDYNDDEYPAWLVALLRFHKHADMHPWGSPTLAMLEWAKRVIEVRPAPDGEAAFAELCDTIGIDVATVTATRAALRRA